MALMSRGGAAPDLCTARPDVGSIDDQLAEARKMLEAKVAAKVGMNRPGGAQEGSDGATYLRYQPSETAGGGPQVQSRMVKMVQAQSDPLEPPKFRVKRAPAGPPSPPAPVLHSPPRKATMQDMQSWKVPPCISNYKNPKGYVIPLDKRLAADGRGLQEVQISDKFAKFSQVLAVADAQEREKVEKRNQMAKKMAMKQKEQREAKLREMAMEARQQKFSAGEEEDTRTWEERDEERKRDDVRRQRRDEWEKARRIADRRASGRGRADRELERDLGEKVALGVAQPTAGNDSFLDQRLFNQDASSGLGGGFDEDAGAYTKSLLGSAGHRKRDFRPTREGLDEEHKRQAGGGGIKTLEFEASRDADPFGMDDMLDDVKEAARRKKHQRRSPSRSSRSSSDSGDRRRKRRR